MSHVRIPILRVLASVVVLVVMVIGVVPLGTVRANDKVYDTCPDAATFKTDVLAGGTLTFNTDCLIDFSSIGKIIFTSTVELNGNGYDVILDGKRQTNLFYVNHPGALTVNGITVQNGYSSSFPDAAIHNEGGILNVSNSLFRNNSGAIHNNAGRPGVIGDAFISNSTFSNNVIVAIGTGGAGGGAVKNNINSYMEITNSSFIQNGATSIANATGGALTNASGRGIRVTGCTFAENFVNGTKGRGGAFAGVAGGGWLTNNTFTSNTANGTQSSNGGAIWIHGTGSAYFIDFNTITDNSAAIGGGIYLDDWGRANLTATIISGNRASVSGENCAMTGSNTYFADVYNLEHGSTSCGFVYSLASDDLMLGPLQNNGGPTQTIALLPGSAAIDVIQTGWSGGINFDQRGEPRPIGQGYDIGAYETSAVPVVEEPPVEEPPTEEPPVDDPPNIITDLAAGDGFSLHVPPGHEERVYARIPSEDTCYLNPPPPGGYIPVLDPCASFYDVFQLGDQGNLRGDQHVRVCFAVPEERTDFMVGVYVNPPNENEGWTMVETSPQNWNDNWKAHGQAQVCARIPYLGVVSIFAPEQPAASAPPPAAGSSVLDVTPVNCTLETTHRINFRETPGGKKINRVPWQTTLNTTSAVDGWYQVEWLGEVGWVSADYVTAVCQ